MENFFCEEKKEPPLNEERVLPLSRTRVKQNAPPPDFLPLASILNSIDAVWNILYINPAAAELGGKVALEIPGKDVWTEFPQCVGSYFEYACRRAMRAHLFGELVWRLDST